MSIQIAFLLVVIGIGAALFISELLRPDLIAILMLLALAFTGLVTPGEAFAGLSSPAVVLLIAVFIITGALFRTGVSEMIGRNLERIAGTENSRLIALVMLAAAGLSLLMNNIASGAVLMPAIMDVSRRTKTNPSRLLLPMAYATQLGGMATLFTTSNVVASGILIAEGYKGFGVLDFASVGGLAALAGIAFMVIWGWRLLPNRNPSRELAAQSSRPDLMKLYQIREKMHEARVQPKSILVGKPLNRSGIGSQLGLTVLAIERDGRTLISPPPQEVILGGDMLLVAGRDEKVNQLKAWGTQVYPTPGSFPDPRSAGLELLEVIPAPHSNNLGRTIRDLQFRTKYGLNVIAFWRRGIAFRTAFASLPLESSDALLVYGPRQDFQLLENDPDWLVLRLRESRTIRRGKMGLALTILGMTLGLTIFSPLPIHLVMFIGAIAMILTGCLRMEEAYQSIDWRSVFLVGGMLPVGIALTKTGTAALLGNQMTALLGGLGPLAIIAGLFLVTTILNQFIPGGSAVPAVLVPIAIAAARLMGSDPRAFALVVAIATGTSLLTPFAHPVNVLVMGPGGYHFKDYLKAGAPLVIITFIVVMLTLPIFWHV